MKRKKKQVNIRRTTADKFDTKNWEDRVVEWLVLPSMCTISFNYFAI